VLAVVGIIWLVRSSGSSPSSTASPRETPDEVLSRRYAAGEIDDEEYARRRSGLS
jgi:putative membrane protein